MASTLKHLRSSTADKRPTASGLVDGQLAINTASGTPAVFFKDSNGGVVKVGPAHVGASAPNAVPAGSAGNSLGELWVDNGLTTPGLNYYTGSAFVNLTPSGTTTTVGLVELATPAETQTGTDAARAVTPSGLQSKVSDSTSTTSSTTIASSTAVKSAYDLANAALPKAGGTVTGELLIGNTGSLVFEGSSDDSFETTIAVTNPTADHIITFPNVTGTVVTTGDSGTVTSTMIANDTIVNADINSAAAIAYSKLALSSGIVNTDISASAAIAHSKLAALTSANILLGNASNVATSTAVTGDVTISNAGVTAIAAGAIVDADISASAEIAVSKLADGAARQLLQTDAAGTGVEWASNIDIPGTLDVTSAATFDSSVAVTGALTKSGNNVVTVGDTGTVTSTMILDGTILNADVNASAAIAGTKVSPDFGSQNVTTTGTVTGASLSPTSSSVPTNGVYLPAANSVAVATNGTQRLTVDTAATTSTLPVVHPLGAVGTPSITFTGDLNTGIWSPAADTIAFSEGGVEAMRIDSSGRLGIGTTSPNALLDVTNGGFQLTDTSSSFAASESISYYHNTSTQYAEIQFKPQNASQGYIYFKNRVGSALTDVLTIQGSNVGIGTTAATDKLHLHEASSNACYLHITNDTTGSAAADGVIVGLDSSEQFYIYSYENNNLIFGNNNTERARIDSSGRLLVGTSSARTAFGITSNIQSEGTGYDSGSINLVVNNNSNVGISPFINLCRSRGTANGSNSVVQSNDSLGAIAWCGADGSNLTSAAASIRAFVDGTPGANDMPGRLVFSTTSDGASSPTERMRIGSDGILYLGATSTLGTIPNARLQVRGSNAATFQGDSGNAGSQVVYIHHTNTSGNNLFLEFGTEASIATRGSVDYNRAAGQVRYNVTSDRRLKSDIQPAGTALNALSAIQVRSYKWAETGYQVDHGFIAQELNEIAPDAVKVGDDGDEVTDTWAVDNGKLVPLLIKALQEAIAKIETLEARLTAAGIE